MERRRPMKNTNDFKKAVFETFGDEYSVLGEYVDKNTKVRVRHNLCGNEFDVIPYYLIVGSAKCSCLRKTTKGRTLNNHPYTRTTEDFKKLVFDIVGDEYTVIGEYVNSSTKILMRHNVCGNEWYVNPSNFLKGSRCPNENGFKHKTNEEFQNEFSSLNNGIICLDEYINSHTKIRFKHIDCGYIFERTPNDALSGKWCPVCGRGKAVLGYTDLWSTDYDLALCLKNKEDGYKYKYGTHTKLEFICPHCGKLVVGSPREVSDLETHVFKCKYCKDSVSYPEKVMINLLDQLGVNYIHQAGSKDLKWCKKYKYDFYLPILNCIIEMNGIQHYKDVKSWTLSLDEVKENDRIKQELAINNQITEYIVIDARYSDIDFIKANILNSVLNRYFDLSLIDWHECHLYSLSSNYIETIKLWNSGIHYLPDIQTILHISDTTVYRYLEEGNKYNLCDFNKEEYKELIKEGWYKKTALKHGKKVVCLDNNNVFDTVSFAERYYHCRSISRAIRLHQKSGGYHWAYYDDLDKSFLDNNVFNYIEYIPLRKEARTIA